MKKPVDKPAKPIDGPAKPNPPLVPPRARCAAASVALAVLVASDEVGAGSATRDKVAAGFAFGDEVAAGSTARDEVGLESAACR